MINLPIGEYESILQPYYDGGDSYQGHEKYSVLSRYFVEPRNHAEQKWDSVAVFVDPGKTTAIERECDIDISDYDAARLFCTANSSVKIQVYFNSALVINDCGTGKLDYLEGAVDTVKLKRLRLVFENRNSTSQTANLVYLGLFSRNRMTKAPQNPFSDEWEGCLSPNPHAGIFGESLITQSEFEVLCEKLNQEPFSKPYQAMKIRAREAMKTAPETMIRKTVHERYRKPALFSGALIALAFVGQVEKNEEMLKMACRYALSLACCTYWCSDMMEETPTVTWHHRSFTESEMSSAMAIAICFAGNRLTWHGRNLLYQALIMKGLPRMEADFMTMDYIYHMNQGLAFLSGYVYALTVLAERYPRYDKRLEDAEVMMNEMFANAINQDGSTNEGAGYWQYTLINYLTSACLIAKRKKVDFKDYLGDKLKKTSDFGLFLLDEDARFIPWSDCGGGMYLPYICNIFAYVTGDKRWGRVYHATSTEEIMFAFFLTAKEIEDSDVAMTKEFECFENAGMVSVYRNGIRFVGISGPSNSTHSHQDKGSFLLYQNGNPLVIDLGSMPYDVADGDKMRTAAFHNLCLPEGTEQLIGDDYAAILIKAEYQDGKLTWISDNTGVWGAEIIKNIRSVHSEKENEYIVTDEFIFVKPMAASFRLNLIDDTLLTVIPLDWTPDKRSCEKCNDSKGNPVYQIRLYTGKTERLRITTKIIVG